MTKEFDLLVYIGRFQPLHNSHVKTIETALEMSEKVLVAVGSVNQPRSLRNPWTWEERATMIFRVFVDEYPNVLLYPVHDILEDNESWARQIKQEVFLQGDKKVGLIGHHKDDSTFYLDLFPEWGQVEMENIDGLNATDIRGEYFGLSKIGKEISSILHPEVYNYLMEFEKTKEFEKLWEEIYNDKPNSKYG